MHLEGIAAVSGVVVCLTACASVETTATDGAAADHRTGIVVRGHHREADAGIAQGPAID